MESPATKEPYPRLFDGLLSPAPEVFLVVSVQRSAVSPNRVQALVEAKLQVQALMVAPPPTPRPRMDSLGVHPSACLRPTAMLTCSPSSAGPVEAEPHRVRRISEAVAVLAAEPFESAATLSSSLAQA